MKMRIQRNHTKRKGDYLEEMMDNFIERKSKKKCGSSRIMTCLQFTFVVYATSVLLYIRPPIDLSDYISRFVTVSNPDSGGVKDQSGIGVCEYEKIDFEQKKSNDTVTIKLKKELYSEVLDFQSKAFGIETLSELMAMESTWYIKGHNLPKITVILNHYKRKTLCAQIDSILQQTLPFHRLWVVVFGSSIYESVRKIVESYNNSRISVISSNYDFKYYGKFQLALQAQADLVYSLDDDMIPGRKMLEILSHVAGTEKYRNSVLGSSGRILPFRRADSYFPSYRKVKSKEAGLYLPDPAFDIILERVVRVDFLSSSWFMSTELIKALFIETPFTFTTGEDLHLSYQLQKYLDAGSFVLPVDPNDKETWGDTEHRLAYISESAVKDTVKTRDGQWWKALLSGYVTVWASMYPQKIDALFYAHSLDDVQSMAPLIHKFETTFGKKAYIAVSGGRFCPCEEAALILQWSKFACTERRFKILDLGINSLSGESDSEVPVLQSIHASMKGIIKIHNPSVVITVSEVDKNVKKALMLTTETSRNRTTLIQIPKDSISRALWIADVHSRALPYWNRMKLSISIITQNRAASLSRLLNSLSNAFYLGDTIQVTFNMDSQVDEPTLRLVKSFEWKHGPKIIRRRIIQGGLIRAVSESWYPSSNDDFGLILEDDIEVSPLYYMWIKYTILSYYYDPKVSLQELNSISLYTPRLIEVPQLKRKWNATDFFKRIHPNTPYLHQLPCSWGAVFFPKHWREFVAYMSMRYIKQIPVGIPYSRTNQWKSSWKKYLIDMMYLRGYVTLYPNFPNQTSFSTNHLEPGEHINEEGNDLQHKKMDYEVPLMKDEFMKLLPSGKLPRASSLPSLDLFNQHVSLKGLKVEGARLRQDVIECRVNEIVVVNHETGLPSHCAVF